MSGWQLVPTNSRNRLLVAAFSVNAEGGWPLLDKPRLAGFCCCSVPEQSSQLKLSDLVRRALNGEWWGRERVTSSQGMLGKIGKQRAWGDVKKGEYIISKTGLKQSPWTPETFAGKQGSAYITSLQGKNTEPFWKSAFWDASPKCLYVVPIWRINTRS